MSFYGKKGMLDIAGNGLNLISYLPLRMRVAKYNSQVAQQISESPQSNLI